MAKAVITVNVAELPEVEAAMQALNTDLDEALKLLDSFTPDTDDDPCSFDHHGGCQAHGFLSLRPGQICPAVQAHGMLVAHAYRTDPKI